MRYLKTREALENMRGTNSFAFLLLWLFISMPALYFFAEYLRKTRVTDRQMCNNMVLCVLTATRTKSASFRTASN